MSVSKAIATEVRSTSRDTRKAIACMVGVAAIFMYLIGCILNIPVNSLEYGSDPVVMVLTWSTLWAIKAAAAATIAYVGGNVLVFMRWFFFQRPA